MASRTCNDKIPCVDRYRIPAVTRTLFDHALIPQGSGRLTLHIEKHYSDNSRKHDADRDDPKHPLPPVARSSNPLDQESNRDFADGYAQDA